MKTGQWYAFLSSVVTSSIMAVVFMFMTFQTKAEAQQDLDGFRFEMNHLQSQMKEIGVRVETEYRRMNDKLDRIQELLIQREISRGWRK